MQIALYWTNVSGRQAGGLNLHKQMLLVSFRIRCTSHFQTERNVFSRSTVAASPMLSKPPPRHYIQRARYQQLANTNPGGVKHTAGRLRWKPLVCVWRSRQPTSAELRCDCGGHSLCHMAVVKIFLTCPPRRSRQAAVSAPLRSDQKERPRLFNQNLFSVVICHPTSIQRWLTARRNRVGLMQRCMLLLASSSPPSAWRFTHLSEGDQSARQCEELVTHLPAGRQRPVSSCVCLRVCVCVRDVTVSRSHAVIIPR